MRRSKHSVQAAGRTAPSCRTSSRISFSVFKSTVIMFLRLRCRLRTANVPRYTAFVPRLYRGYAVDLHPKYADKVKKKAEE